jgi:hypothetical protein
MTGPASPTARNTMAPWIHLVVNGQAMFTMNRPVTSISTYPGITKNATIRPMARRTKRAVVRMASVELEDNSKPCTGSQCENRNQDVEELQQEVAASHSVRSGLGPLDPVGP